MNGTVDVGRVDSACSTVERSTGGTISSMRRCFRSGFAASTRERIATPSRSSGKMLRKP
jgi:hypothetical protein